MSAARRNGALAFTAAIVLVTSACGVVYVNQADREPTYAAETSFVASERPETTYRIIYTRLLDCTSGYYRVGGEFDNMAKHGEISVDTGIGFQRTLFLADAHVMSIDIVPGGGATSKVTVRRKSETGAHLVRAMEPWVNRGAGGCGE
ncbi:MAG: hypothetical protein R3286_10055 [Gammaproteobacteria bacterium]|nr:hypothetical protein [Gammaproteobacteria bacterium]